MAACVSEIGYNASPWAELVQMGSITLPHMVEDISWLAGLVLDVLVRADMAVIARHLPEGGVVVADKTARCVFGKETHGVSKRVGQVGGT